MKRRNGERRVPVPGRTRDRSLLLRREGGRHCPFRKFCSFAHWRSGPLEPFPAGRGGVVCPRRSGRQVALYRIASHDTLLRGRTDGVGLQVVGDDAVAVGRIPGGRG